MVSRCRHYASFLFFFSQSNRKFKFTILLIAVTRVIFDRHQSYRHCRILLRNNRP